MNLFEVLMTGVALSMDAFAVSICKGLVIHKNRKRNALIIALYFGFFQFGMPILGYLFGSIFDETINTWDHWIAFILLSYIGINMLCDRKEEQENDKVDLKTMIPLSIATSIDALAVGVTFSFLKVMVLPSSIIIGITTTTLTFIGVQVGNKFGKSKEKKSKIVGGVLLILIGIKILFEHLEILNLFSRLF